MNNFKSCNRDFLHTAMLASGLTDASPEKELLQFVTDYAAARKYFELDSVRTALESVAQNKADGVSQGLVDNGLIARGISIPAGGDYPDFHYMLTEHGYRVLKILRNWEKILGAVNNQ